MNVSCFSPALATVFLHLEGLMLPAIGRPPVLQQQHQARLVTMLSCSLASPFVFVATLVNLQEYEILTTDEMMMA